MRIKVFAPSFLNLSALDAEGYITLNEGATVGTLYKKLKVPLALRPFMISSVNYKSAKMNQELRDGDTVSFLTPLSGG
jgi:molybdopterin converting factor small subunit